MSVTLYFSKVNLNSHIFKVYDKKIKLEETLDKLYTKINEKVEYTREDMKTVEYGETYTYDATYNFNFLEKLDFPRSIVGSIFKKSPLFFNEVDSNTGKLRKMMVDNTEVIEFYFDVHKEIVVFYTTNRFGFQEFNHAFGELLNRSMSNAEENYYFDVSLLKEGLSVDRIKEQLKSIGKLHSLKIEIIPPNADDEFLDKIQKNGEKYLNNIKAGNVTQTSILFTSRNDEGLNLDAEIINEEIEKIEDIHSELSAELAIRNGYVKVEAESKEGRKYTTNDNRSIKDKLEEKPSNPILFAEVCRKKIESLLNMFF
ncbi:hypothetical protein [Paenibacillus sp. HJGM_3]|uniref:hypothetical protein n=1 Tax=Paenibacillus sp. HJGM_3 TaxID=3379816 RepID=UPI00385EC9B2